MRLHILIAISDEGELFTWTGKAWINWEGNKNLPIYEWKENQSKREAQLSMRFLPKNISSENVFWPRVQRPGNGGD